MKGPAIDQLVYSAMFPNAKPSDPQNFQGLLQRHLVTEVRLETQAFYGHLRSQEAKYPGLDYSYQPHRYRLSRYPWHRRLFRAFDGLGLTKSEIAGLTKWEGTRWAKERYEREQDEFIRDTAGDLIADWVEPEFRVPVTAPVRPDTDAMDTREDGEIDEDEGEEEGEENEMDEDVEEDSDVEITSVGVELNQRLRAAVAQREAGDATIVMDEEWEQWLKDAVEAGGLPFSSSDLSPNANIPGTRPATGPASHLSQSTAYPRFLNAARLGRWHEVPDFLHNAVRQNIEASNLRLENTPPNPLPTPASNPTSNSSSNASSALSSGESSPYSSRTQRPESISSLRPASTRLLARLQTPERRSLDTTPRRRLTDFTTLNIGPQERRPFASTASSRLMANNRQGSGNGAGRSSAS